MDSRTCKGFTDPLRRSSEHPTFKPAAAFRRATSMIAPALCSSGGRKRKRQRVSFAAAELLEEVKLFHMAKPVNPSIPPPVVDDAGEDDASSQPGLALLGLLGVESPSFVSSSALPSPSTLGSSSTTSHAAAAGDGAVPIGGTHSRVGAAAGQQSTEGAGGGEAGARGSGNSSTTTTTSNGDEPAIGGGGTGRAAGGSKLFKGFEKTETVVRRKKHVAPPLPPPGTPPPLPPAGDAPHLTHRYPKDIWPGHTPPNHASREGDTKGGGIERVAEEQLEFFCDGCDETIPNGVERMECAVCPDEYCLCQSCYDEGEVLDKRHEHELLPSVAPFHVTCAATSAEAAVEAAKALHVTEARQEEGSAYDDDDLG